MELPINQIKSNPNNPRIIKDYRFKKLVKSLQDFPEMASVREVVVNKDYMILGGNMRFKAMKEAGWKKIPVRVVDWPESKQKEFIIKDNVAGGEWDWDVLANEWDTELLTEWDLDLPFNDANKINEQDEWLGMPDYDTRDKLLKIVVNFETKEDRQSFEKLLGVKVPEGIPSVWWPLKNKDDVNSLKLE